MRILNALSGGDVGRRQSAPDLATASAEADRNAELMRKMASGRVTAAAELAELKAQRPALIIAGDSKGLDALERKITAAEREIERTTLVMPELRRQGEAAGVAVLAAKLAKHRELHRAALGGVVAALAQLAEANQVARGVMTEAARDLGQGESPWRITYFAATLPGAVEHWQRHTLVELEQVMRTEVGPRIVLVRLLQPDVRLGNAGETISLPKPEADRLVTPRGLLPARAEFVDPFEQVEAAPPPMERPLPDPPPSPPPPKPALVIPASDSDGMLAVEFTAANTTVVARARGEDRGTFGRGERVRFPRDQAVRLVQGGSASFYDLTANAAPAPEVPADAP